MKIATISDPHVSNHKRFNQGKMENGLNDRGQICIDTLREAYQVARDNDVDMMIINGDLFDKSMESPGVINAVAEVLAFQKMETWITRGNHTANSLSEGDSSVSFLSNLMNVWVSERPMIDFVSDDQAIISIPWSNEPPEVYIAKELMDLRDNYQDSDLQWPEDCILSLHCGLLSPGTPKNLAQFASATAMPQDKLVQLCKRYNIKAVFMGDWHHKEVARVDGILIAQIGTLCPASFSDPVDAGNMLIYDTETGETTWKRIPGPRFVSGNHTAEIIEKLANAKVDEECEVFVRITAHPDECSKCKTSLEALYDATVLTVPIEPEFLDDEDEVEVSAPEGVGLLDAVIKHVSELPSKYRAKLKSKIKELLK